VTESAMESTTKDKAPVNRARGLMFALAGWLVPGLGHLLLRRRGKAAAYFVCVAALAITGLIMRGGVFAASASDLFDRLGFYANLGLGGFYFLARALWVGAPDIAHASGDYGTRIFAAAGVLNLLAVLEAFEIGSGRRE